MTVICKNNKDLAFMFETIAKEINQFGLPWTRRENFKSTSGEQFRIEIEPILFIIQDEKP